MFDPDVAFSLMALPDLGAASAKVIKERDRHRYAIYPLTSTAPLPYRAFIEAVADVMGREDVVLKRLPLAEAVDTLCDRLYATRDVDPAGQRWPGEDVALL